MALSDKQILEAIRGREIKIAPFVRSSLGGAGYDLRSATTVRIRPRQFSLTSTLERVEVGAKFLGLLHIRSSFAREGVLGSLALVDPGFRGQLTIALYNANFGKTVVVGRGERFLQITFVKITHAASRSYKGRYQNSTGVVGSHRRDTPKNV